VRIVAGSARGTRLVAVPPGVRPLSDRAREGVFASLGSRVEGTEVLDLFAGTGAIGIEALSRGAAHSTFVERSGPALAALRDNLAKTHLADRGHVVAADVLAFLAGLPPGDRPGAAGGPFGLVFLDPPYELGGPDLEDALQHLADGWLAGEWTVALTRGRRTTVKGNPNPVIQLHLPVHWGVAKELRYGDSLVTLFREVAWA
jgi:16S rRNA (guanine966-N2)-methyltransferase